MADVIPVSLSKAFDNDVGELHSAAKNAEDAKENHRRAFVDLCTKIYLFKNTHGEDEIADWLEAKDLKVTAKANDWTPVVKLAFAVKQADGKWTVSNAQVNKYANVMRYAEATDVNDGEMEGWIGERTLTELISAARLALRDNSDDEEEEPQTKITRYLSQLKETWEPFFEKGLPKAVDLTQAPVQAGKVQIMAEVDDKGNITPLGIMQVDQPKLLSLLAPAKSKTPLADDLSQSISGVKTSIHMPISCRWAQTSNAPSFSMSLRTSGGSMCASRTNGVVRLLRRFSPSRTLSFPLANGSWTQQSRRH